MVPRLLLYAAMTFATSHVGVSNGPESQHGTSWAVDA
jgi:hypothetical protein